MIGGLRDVVGDRLLRRLGRASAQTQERRDLAVDLLETDEEYLAVFDAPGAEPRDVQVRYADGRVFVRVERVREFQEGFTMRFPGRGLSLEGSVELPPDAVVNAGAAEATLTDAGTLEVRLPSHDDRAHGGDRERTGEREEGDADASTRKSGPDDDRSHEPNDADRTEDRGHDRSHEPNDEPDDEPSGGRSDDRDDADRVETGQRERNLDEDGRRPSGGTD